jgi:fatty acid desaturase
VQDFETESKKIKIDNASKSSVYGALVLLRTSSMFLGVFFLVAEFYSRTIIWLVLAPLLFGLGGYRVQFVLHDTSHYSLFKTRKTNERVGYVCGLFVGVDYRRYRFTHMWHHRRNGEVKDPQFQDYLGAENLSRRKFLLFLVSPLLGSRLIPYLQREMTKRQVDGEEAPKSGVIWWTQFLCAQLTLFMFTTIFTEKFELLLFYYLGLSTTTLFLARIRTIAEHQQINTDLKDFSRSHKWNALDWLFFYDANFNLHVEHHAAPYIQSKYLKVVSQHLRDSSDLTYQISPSIYRTLRTIYLGLPR